MYKFYRNKETLDHSKKEKKYAIIDQITDKRRESLI